MLLENRGIKVAMLKFDPYLNVDPGTMSPLQHGEVYVTEDGTETDLDLGHYFRFTQSPLSKVSNVTSGKIYDSIIKKERRGDYLGHTVQVIPHVTDEIKKAIQLCSMQQGGVQVTLVEVGGTVGDIESQPFMEAIRQFHLDHPGSCINIHLAYIPYLEAAGEMKTKPMQHSVQMLRSLGLFPDLIFCRSKYPLKKEVKEKIALFCSVPKTRVLEMIDLTSSIYELPLHLVDQKLDQQLGFLLNLPDAKVDLSKWKGLVDKIKTPKATLRVGLVGKYLTHQDAYKSVGEALRHGAAANGVQIDICGIDADDIKREKMDACDGYLVPGGFGKRGFEGKLRIARMCRTQRIPYFGICFGMHALVVEFARSVLALKEANSTEIDPNTKDPVICLLSDQDQVTTIGGTMRLGAYPCVLHAPSKAFEMYGKKEISERHRHRYEFNNQYRSSCEKEGLLISGVCPENRQCEIVELADHPWMLGVQFHPEFKSKLSAPHPLFSSFIASMLKEKKVGKSARY